MWVSLLHCSYCVKVFLLSHTLFQESATLTVSFQFLEVSYMSSDYFHFYSEVFL